MARNGDAEGSRLDEAARAGWLYYVAGNTQDEIAQKMRVSRQTAQRIVAETRGAVTPNDFLEIVTKETSEMTDNVNETIEAFARGGVRTGDTAAARSGDEDVVFLSPVDHRYSYRVVSTL